VETAERFADGEVGLKELDSAWIRIIAAERAKRSRKSGRRPDWKLAALATTNHLAAVAARETSLLTGRCAAHTGKHNRKQCELMRDIFRPFLRQTIHVTWRTVNVVSLSQAIYQQGCFENIPILGDALEDAGCDNADILEHCRKPREHVRGCWVADLVLGKE
jgi:hypothetical protein